MPIKGIVLLVIMVIVLAWCFRDEIAAWVKKETKDSENKGEKIIASARSGGCGSEGNIKLKTD